MITLIIQILNGQGEVKLTVRRFFEARIMEELNSGASLDLHFEAEDQIRKTRIRRGYRINLYFYVNKTQTPQVFSGYIQDLKIRGNEVSILAYDWINYLQNRIFHSDKTYNQPINTILTDAYERINDQYTAKLPFQIRDNTLENTVNLVSAKGDTFAKLLNDLQELHPDLQYRILGEKGFAYLDLGEDIGRVLEGEWNYSIDAPERSNIQGWQWLESLDNFWNSMLSVTGSGSDTAIDQASIDDMGLVFERYESAKQLNPRVNVHDAVIPSIELPGDLDRWNIQIGDRKNIRIKSQYDWMQIEYLGLIQSKEISISAMGVSSRVKVSEKYLRDSNILDTVLSGLRRDVDSIIKN